MGNQKQLEVSEEKARRREEKYQDQIKQINIRLKQAEARSEYAEMNISKLNLRMKSSVRNSRSMLSLASLMTPSMRCSTSTRLSDLCYSTLSTFQTLHTHCGKHDLVWNTRSTYYTRCPG